MSIMQSSLMGAELARQSNSGRKHSGRVQKPGGSDLFLAALFKLVDGPVGCCLPAGSILGTAFQLCHSNAP